MKFNQFVYKINTDLWIDFHNVYSNFNFVETLNLLRCSLLHHVQSCSQFIKLEKYMRYI